MEHEALAPGARWAHVAQFAFALRDFLHNDTCVSFIHVDDDFFDGFHFFAGDWVVLIDYAGTTHGQFKTFATHGFDENAQLQFTTARHFKSVGFSFGGGDAQCDVAFGLAQQTFADDARLHLVAFLAGKRSVVDAKRHGKRWRINGRCGDGFGDCGVNKGI